MASSIIIFSGHSLAQTTSAPAKDEKVQHYEAKEIKTAADALRVLDETSAQVASVLKNTPLSTAQLEEIHKITYTMEAAVEVLRGKETAANKAQRASLADNVEVLHKASESHAEQRTRDAYKDVQADLAAVKALFK